MASTVAASTPRTHPKPLRRDLDSLRAGDANLRIGSESLRSTPKDEVLALIDEARQKVGMSRKEMAGNAGCPESVLSEALAGGRSNFAAHWLWQQPDAFVVEFFGLASSRRGLSPESKVAVRAARIAELIRLLVPEVA